MFSRRVKFSLFISGWIALAWLLAQVAIYITRFGVVAFRANVMAGPISSLVVDFLAFSTVGLLSGLLLMAFVRHGQLKRNIGVISGYILATPIALMMAIAGDLLFPVIGTVMLGWPVLAIGIISGYGAVRLYEFGVCCYDGRSVRSPT